jgi:hypothetical protein
LETRHALDDPPARRYVREQQRGELMRSVLGCVGFGLALVIAVGCTATTTDTSEESVATSEDALGSKCDTVRCALPLCAQGQHLAYQGSCCATCVGPESKCAAVMCAMIKCASGYEAVTPTGQCCPRCVKAAPVAECTTDADCPSYACIACPCPVSTCVGRTCQTTTPDASTCASP